MEKLRGLVGKLSSSGAAITKAADLKGPIELGGNNPALQFGMLALVRPRTWSARFESCRPIRVSGTFFCCLYGYWVGIAGGLACSARGRC